MNHFVQIAAIYVDRLHQGLLDIVGDLKVLEEAVGGGPFVLRAGPNDLKDTVLFERAIIGGLRIEPPRRILDARVIVRRQLDPPNLDLGINPMRPPEVNQEGGLARNSPLDLRDQRAFATGGNLDEVETERLKPVGIEGVSPISG